MTKFTFKSDNANQQYIGITAVFPTSVASTIIELPSWRPGRYELGNFSKNVKSFKVYDDQNKQLSAYKSSKDSWEVDTSSTEFIRVEYQYYAAELNAGSSYLSDDQLYVNPVNCCVYTEETFHRKIQIELSIPEKWIVATSMNEKDGLFEVENFDTLFDSPFVASANLQRNHYESGGVKFNVWFNGEVKPDWERVLKDFKAFSDKQIEKFIEFPVKEYHFIIQVLPFRRYHGVEHLASTMIALGPGYDMFDEVYEDLLGVSSHELYHVWNVKAIRPIEMYPYDFKKENYSRLGYICEGITTYQGDLFLFKSGVFDEEQYFKEFNQQLQKHFDNFGRLSYSVAESSYDTWLDGYESGTPNRKVSIYTEGCLLAFVTDVRLRKATNDKYGLDEVMKRLYHNFALKDKGVSEADYKELLESISGENWDDFFSDFVNGNKPYESILTEALDYLGLNLVHVPSDSYEEAKLGMKTTRNGKEFVVKAMYPGGPAETGGLMLEDSIIAVNDYVCDGELEKWLKYFDEDIKKLTIQRFGALMELTLPEVNRNFYMTYSIKKQESPNAAQKKAFEAWKK